MVESMAFGFGLPESSWKPPEELPPLPEGLTMGLDTETRDPLLKTLGPGWAWPDQGEVVGVSFSTDELGTFYLPFGHAGGDNLDRGIVQEYVQDLVNAAGKVVMHNASYDVGWLSWFGVTVPPEKVHDTGLMEPLLDENARGYSLEAVAKRYGFETKSEETLKMACKALGYGDPKSHLWRLPARYVGEYAEQDARLALQLAKSMYPEIQKQNLEGLYDLERSLVVPLNEVRRRGVRVDVPRAERALVEIRQRRDRQLRYVRELTGFRIDPWDANSIARALQKEGVEVPRTPKTNQPSVTKGFLEGLTGSKVGAAVVEARRWDKAAGTFVEGQVLKSAQIDGRVHAQLNQLMSDEGGTVSGRFSCSKPNLQFIPNRDPEVKALVRSLYLPEEGQEWGVLDYSQQEPRLAVHWAHRAGVRGASEAVRRYREEPDMSFHVMVAEMTGLDYKPAKMLNLGMFYGMGGAKFCETLGLPTRTKKLENGDVIEVAGEEGQRMLDAYHENVPFVRGLSDRAERVAKRRKYITTLLGRRCRFVNDWDYRKAMNRLIQGSAADQTKQAMKLMMDEGLHVLTTVHDEVDISFSSDEEWKKGRELMEHAVELRVPSKVEVEVGPNWGEVKDATG